MDEFALEVLGELIDFVKMASPELWRICARQAMAEGWADVFLAISALIIGLFSLWGLFKAIKAKITEELIALLGIVVIVALFISIATGIDAIKYLFNPEFYALQILADLLPQ